MASRLCGKSQEGKQLKFAPRLVQHHLLNTVKLANSASPFKFRQVNFPQKTGLELLL